MTTIKALFLVLLESQLLFLARLVFVKPSEFPVSLKWGSGKGVINPWDPELNSPFLLVHEMLFLRPTVCSSSSSVAFLSAILHASLILLNLLSSVNLERAWWVCTSLYYLLLSVQLGEHEPIVSGQKTNYYSKREIKHTQCYFRSPCQLVSCKTAVALAVKLR